MHSEERPSPEQTAALRAIPGEKRLRLAEQLYWSARKLKAAALRLQATRSKQLRTKREAAIK